MVSIPSSPAPIDINSMISDYNFVRHGNECIPVGPEPIEAGVCSNPEHTYMGSSGYRLIPGNTCDRTRGSQKDEKVSKKCSQGACLMAWFVLTRR